MDKYLTPEELAQKLAVHPQSVRLWLREGTIKGLKIGRIWRIPEAEVQRFLAISGYAESATA